MFSTILVTVDLTEAASWRHALPQAVELAQLSGGTLHVLSVVHDFGTPLVEGFFPPDMRKKALRHAGAQVQALIDAEIPEGVPVKPHVAYGVTHTEILKTIERIGADLVVMASHAPEGMREFLVGSQADRVVRRAPVSVLVVRGA